MLTLILIQLGCALSGPAIQPVSAKLDKATDYCNSKTESKGAIHPALANTKLSRTDFLKFIPSQEQYEYDQKGPTDVKVLNKIITSPSLNPT